MDVLKKTGVQEERERLLYTQKMTGYFYASVEVRAVTRWTANSTQIDVNQNTKGNSAGN